MVKALAQTRLRFIIGTAAELELDLQVLQNPQCEALELADFDMVTDKQRRSIAVDFLTASTRAESNNCELGLLGRSRILVF